MRLGRPVDRFASEQGITTDAYRFYREQLEKSAAMDGLGEKLLEIEKNLLEGWDIREEFDLTSNLLIQRIRLSALPAVRPVNCDPLATWWDPDRPDSAEFTYRIYLEMLWLLWVADERAVDLLDLGRLSLVDLRTWLTLDAARLYSRAVRQSRTSNLVTGIGEEMVKMFQDRYESQLANQGLQLSPPVEIDDKKIIGFVLVRGEYYDLFDQKRSRAVPLQLGELAMDEPKVQVLPISRIEQTRETNRFEIDFAWRSRRNRRCRSAEILSRGSAPWIPAEE